MNTIPAFCWLVLIDTNPAGMRWHTFASRRAARAFRHEHGGKLYHLIEVH